MKRRIRLSERGLHRVVSESVKRILEESCWYGDTKPFEQIIDAANKIMQNFEHVNGEDYEPWDDCDGPDLDPHIYQWAEKVADEAERYMHYNSSYTSINGGED
jgi:hypothetical protein